MTKNNNKYFDFKFDYISPIVFTAIHNGHSIFNNIVKNNLAINSSDRLREEDPYTDEFAKLAGNSIVVNVSRFEIELNRKKDESFYIEPSDSWGLKTRIKKPSIEEIDSSLSIYDEFYKIVEIYFKKLIDKFGFIFILDIHSYNHQRGGVNTKFDDPIKNPDIIIGRSNMPKEYNEIAKVLNSFYSDYSFFANGKKTNSQLDVKYPGGAFPRWVHNRFENQACCIALEYKKFWMNEWTGEIDKYLFEKIKKSLFDIQPLIKKFISNQSSCLYIKD